MVLSITKVSTQAHCPVNYLNFKVSTLTLKISTIRLLLKAIIPISSSLISNSLLNLLLKFLMNSRLQLKLKTLNLNLKSLLCNLLIKAKKCKAPRQQK